MNEYFNFWVQLYNSMPHGAFWCGTSIAFACLLFALYFAKLAWQGKGACEVGPIRALATFGALALGYLSIGFFVTEPLETIERNKQKAEQVKVEEAKKADKCLKGDCLILPELQCKELLCAIGRECMVDHPVHASNGTLYWILDNSIYRHHHLKLVNSGKEYDPGINIEDYLYLFPGCNDGIRNVIDSIDNDKFVVNFYRSFKPKTQKTYERSMFRPTEI